MPQAIYAGLWAVGLTAGTATVVANLITTVLINVGMGALAKALAKKPKRAEPAINVTVRDQIENRRIVFGRRRCGGSFAFIDSTGDKNEILWYVIVYAGHQVEKIGDVWIDKVRISNADIGAGAAGGGAVTDGPFDGKMWIYKHLGTSTQTANTQLKAASGYWTADHRLRGCAYVVVKMERDDAVYPNGAPQDVSALIDGALCYDPRQDDTVEGGSGTHRKEDPRTWEFTENPALHLYWYLSGGSVHNNRDTRKIMYGPRETAARLPDSYFVAAANKCDEQLSGSVAPPSGTQTRYKCGLEVSTGETRKEIVEAILATFAGTLIPTRGQYRVYAGAYLAPQHSFTSHDLYGELEVEDTHDHDRRRNAVAAVFIDEENEYLEQTTIFRTDAGYEAQDGGGEEGEGRRIETEIDLRGVTNQYQAQRLCEIRLRKTRMQRTVKLVGALNLMKVALWEAVSFTHARFGWNNYTFRCIEKEFAFRENAGRVTLTCEADDAAVYNDMLTADYTTGTSDTDTFVKEKPDPVVDYESIGQENAILWRATKPLVLLPGTIFEHRTSASSDMSTPTTRYKGPDLQYIQSRTTTTLVYGQVRAILNGEAGDWFPDGAGVPGKAKSIATALSASVSPGSAQSRTGSASQTTGSVTVTATGGTSPYTYAWTWASGGSGITITSNTSASTTFSATSLTDGETRTGIARCTVTDNVAATYTIDVEVTIERPAPEATAPKVVQVSVTNQPTDAICSFKLDNDGHWYSSSSSATPTTDEDLWCDPVDYVSNFQVRVTRTGGTETAFSSGPALNTWHALSTDRTWSLSNTLNTASEKDIFFTIEIRRASDSVIVSTSTNNHLFCIVNSGIPV